MKDWVASAIAKIEADFCRSADTHLIKLDLPVLPGIDIYFKDESTHPTGSLKHRLARSLFLYALCNGWIDRTTPIIEASSGSTAISEAYFARLLGLRFIAVVPKGTSKEKIDQIAFYGGDCHLVEPREIYSESERLAAELGGHYMDQFTFAERATDWRGNNNIAESIFDQMARERYPIPTWIVASAGTGGTSATIGRFIRYRCLATRLCVPDPENSVFFDVYQSGNTSIEINSTSRIEGIGRHRAEPSFIPSIIDDMIRIPDAAAIAAVRFLETLINRKCGGSTGTNLYATFRIASEMNKSGQSGSLVSLICDLGDRYLDTYYSDAWLQAQKLDLAPFQSALERFAESGELNAAEY